MFGARAPAADALDGAAPAVVERVDAGRITAAVAAGRIPIVAALADDLDATDAAGAAGTLTFPTADAVVALARHLSPLKVIVLRPEGGLRTPDGARVPSVDLGAATTPALRASLPAGDAELLDSLASLYDATVGSSSSATSGATVSVTSPEHLAAEVFTHRGGGTVVLRGERILAYDSLEGLDVPRLAGLVSAAFGAELPADFLPRLAAGADGRRLRRVLVSEGYRAVALVTEEAGMPGVAYLDKFAVAPSAQGDKLGEVLWRAMVEVEPVLYWRSRAANRVNPWYYEQSTGCYKAPAGDWTVFWRGLPEPAIPTAITTALALPPTFPKRVYPGVMSPSSAAAAARPSELPVLK